MLSGGIGVKWRRSEKHPRWHKTFRKLDEIEKRSAPKFHRAKNFNLKFEGKPRLYRLRTSKAYGKTPYKELEPLLDVFEEKEGINVVAELKGFKKENIKVHVEGQKLVVSARAKGRRYYKSLNLLKKVNPETIHTSYKNGVLEIRLKKALEEKAIKKVA
ncbi:MAG: Hsp20/alpha crystallin family protein [Candidatus Bathyarchaeia archaeon]